MTANLMFLTGERRLRPPTPHRAVEPRNGVKEHPAGRLEWRTGVVVYMEAPAPAHARLRALREAARRTGSMANGQRKQSVSVKWERR